ncbi:MAG: hypothetical protein VXX85_06025, partial [Candidatus Margulisiibacteriota bacterium]|nr:hypothetical protein [Candidatus Margulisiibacteriota bacterium]
KDDVKQGLEIAYQGAKNNTLQKQKIRELANKLGFDLEGVMSVEAKPVNEISPPTVPIQTREPRPLSPLLTGQLQDSENRLGDELQALSDVPEGGGKSAPQPVQQAPTEKDSTQQDSIPQMPIQTAPQRDFAGELKAANDRMSKSQKAIKGFETQASKSVGREFKAEQKKLAAEKQLDTAETQFNASDGRKRVAIESRVSALDQVEIEEDNIERLSGELKKLKPGSDAEALVKAQKRLNNANASVEELEKSQSILKGQNTTLSQELGKKQALIGSIESEIKTQQGQQKALIDLAPDETVLDALNKEIAGFKSDISTHQLTIEKNPVTKESIQDEFIERVIAELQHGKGARGSLIKGQNVNEIRAALKSDKLEKLLKRSKSGTNTQAINNYLISKLKTFVGTGNHAVKTLGYKIPTENLGADNAMNQGAQDNANAAIQAIKYKLETAQKTKADIEKSIQTKQQENNRIEKLNKGIDTKIKRLSGNKKTATDEADGIRTQIKNNFTKLDGNISQLTDARNEQVAAKSNLSKIEKANEAADSQYSKTKNGLEEQLKEAEKSKEKALDRINKADETIALEGRIQQKAQKDIISADAAIRQEESVISEEQELQTSLDAQIAAETKKIEEEQRKIAGIFAAQAAQQVAKNATTAMLTSAIDNVTNTTPTDKVVVSAPGGPNLDNQQSDPGKPKGPVRDFEGRQAALLLARIAEQEGLLTGEDLMKEQLLTINQGVIKIDEPDALVKRIIEAASATTDSAGNAGFINSFITDLGLKSEDPATISDVQNDPKLLFTVLKQKEENILNFLSKPGTGELKTNLPDGTTIPESHETIKRLVQVAQRGAPLDVVTIPEKADSKAKIEPDPKKVGNVSSTSEVGPTTNAPDAGMLTLSKGEETVQTDTQDLQNQQASANNDPETKSSNLDEMRSMLTKAGEAMKSFELSVRKAMGQSIPIPTEKVVGELITDGEIAEMTNQGIIDDAKLIIVDSNHELAGLEDKLNQTTTPELDKEIARLEQEISEGQHEYNQMKSGSDGGDGGAISTGSSSIQAKAVSSAGGGLKPKMLPKTLEEKADELDKKKAKLEELRGQRDQKKIEGLPTEDRDKFKAATTAKADAEKTVAEKTKANELLAQQLKDLKTTGARVAVDDMVDLINQKTDGGAKALSAADVTTVANSMADLLAKGADDHVVMSLLDLVSEGGKDKVFNMDIQITKRPIARALMQELVKLTANNKENDPNQRVDKAISNFTSHSPSFKADVASVANQGQLLSATLESAVTGGKSDPAKTRIEESDKQLAEAMRTEINDVLKAIESSVAEPSSDQLKQVVNNMKALCRSGVEYYQKQLPSSDDAFTQDALNNIQVLKNSNMLIQEFQERDGSDVGAKIALINVLNQPGITDTIVFKGSDEGVMVPTIDSFKTYDLNLESTSKPGRMAGLLGKKDSKLTKDQIGQIKSSLRTIAEFTKLPNADVSRFTIQPDSGDNKQQILDFVNDHWDKLDIDQQVAIATHFNKTDNVGVLTPEIKSKFDTVIGKNLVGLVARNMITTSQLEVLESRTGSADGIGSSLKTAKALSIVNGGDIAKALENIKVNNLNDKELATLIRFASKPALDALFKHPQFKIMVGENTGSDDFQTALAGRINQFPDLGQTLFSGLGSIGSRPSAPVLSGTSTELQNNAISELFERLNSSVQDDIIGALSPKEAVNFFKLSAEGKESDEPFSNAEASILVAIAKTNPELLTGILNSEKLSAKRMQASYKDGDASVKNKMEQTVKLLTPKAFKLLCPQDILTPVTADQLSKKQLDDQFKQMLKNQNPVGYMAAVLRDIKGAPSELIEKLFKAYDIMAPSDNSQVINGLKDLGRAGNLNPELMAKLMNEMSSENVNKSTENKDLIDSMNLLSDSAASTDQSLESLKELMVGAMFSHNSLNFVSNQQRMPQTIHTYFEKFSNRMVESGDGFSEDVTTSFCKGLSDFDKRSFLGLIGGISTTHLTQLSDLTPLKNSIAGFVFKHPDCIDGFKTFLGQLFSDESNPIANEIFKGEFSSQLTMIDNISKLCDGKEVDLISLGDLAKFDPQSIPPSKDNFIKLKQAVENIENMLTNQPLTHKQRRSLKALKVMLGARAVVIGNQTGNGEAAKSLVQSMQTSNTRYKYHTEYVGRKPIKDVATFMKDQLEFVQLEFNDTSSQVMDDVRDHYNDGTLLSYLGNSIFEVASKATTSTMNLFNSLAYFDIAGDAFKKSYTDMFKDAAKEFESIFSDSKPVKESAVDYPKAPLENIANRISYGASFGLKYLTALVALPYVSIKLVSTLGIFVTSSIGLPGNITGWSGGNLGNMIIRPVIGLAALAATGLTLFAGGVLASPGLAIKSLAAPKEK